MPICQPFSLLARTKPGGGIKRPNRRRPVSSRRHLRPLPSAAGLLSSRPYRAARASIGLLIHRLPRSANAVATLPICFGRCRKADEGGVSLARHLDPPDRRLEPPWRLLSHALASPSSRALFGLECPRRTHPAFGLSAGAGCNRLD